MKKAKETKPIKTNQKKIFIFKSISNSRSNKKKLNEKTRKNKNNTTPMIN